MTTPKIVWTALPNGIDARGNIRVSVFVSPRLEPAGATGTLADYTLGTWPDVIRTLLGRGALRVAFAPPVGFALPLVPDESYLAALSPTLWTALFPPASTRVEAHSFTDHSRRWLRSYSVRAINQYLETLYKSVSDASTTEFPDLRLDNPLTQLAQTMERALGPIRGALPSSQGRVTGYRPLPGAELPATHPDATVEAALRALGSSSGVPAHELFRAYRFYRRGNQRPYYSRESPRDLNQISPPLTAPRFEFHQVLAALGDHPALLRRLGLVVDGTLALPAGQIPSTGVIRIEVGSPHPAVIDVLPSTRYQVSATGFRAQPRTGSDLREGVLRLDDAAIFEVLQSDVDGAALKTVDFAVNVGKLRRQLLAADTAPPSGTSLGADRDVPSHETTRASLPALRNGGITVARVGRDDQLWAQLARARGFNAAPDAAELSADDLVRGYRVDVKYRGRWYSLCRRTGTLAVAGTTIAVTGPDEGYVKAASGSSDPGADRSGPQLPDLYVHEALFGWDNWSLVAPRPGKTISFEHQAGRRQTVALEHVTNEPAAGFDIAANYKPERLSLPPLRYGELYQFRARAVDLAGNSLAPAPSNLDPTTPLASDTPVAGIGESAPIRYLRHEPVPPPALVPRAPMTAGESVETMVIRSRSTVGLAPGATPAPLPGVDEARVFNPRNERWVAPPKSTVLTAELHARLDAQFRTPDALFALVAREGRSFAHGGAEVKLVSPTHAIVASGPLAKPEELPAGHYVVRTDESLALPYLPDPLAAGVVLRRDGSTVLPRAYLGASSWPELRPFVLALAASPDASVSFALDGDPAVVRLPPGTMLSVKYSSRLASGGREVMARWQGMSATTQSQVAAQQDQHWMLTPSRTLQFVHAVERPVRAPTIVTDDALQIDRVRLGETFASLRSGRIANHAHSTGEIEIRARWIDPVDRLADPAPSTELHEGHVTDLKVGYDEDPREFHARNEPPPRHEFGDTRHHVVRYRPIGTTRYREYFPPSVTEQKDALRVAGPEVTIDIKSSARPDAPRVLYAVPTFRWVTGTDGHSRERQGRGLRIYVDRPWYSSGEGERLGIVLAPATGLAEANRTYVSAWGADPVFDQQGPSAALGPEHLRGDPSLSDALVAGVATLAEAPTQFVRVVGIKPQFDATRKLWWFDVEFVASAAYYTFVRLALCRFQPHSLEGAEISPVVRAQFAQLLADRSASITQTGQSLELSVRGPLARNKLGAIWNAASGGSPPPGGSGPGLPPITLPSAWVPDARAGAAHLVRAQIERRPLGTRGDLGWEAMDGGTVLTSFTNLNVADAGTVLWKGILRWPRPDALSTDEHRVVIREYELFQTDPATASSDLPMADPAGLPVRERLVYTDSFALEH